jgi:hypothetical protein
MLPGRDPLEIPTTSRRALTEAGFEIIEEQQPSFLFDRSVLVTGEVPRTTGYEPGFPPQQAWIGGGWQPDPLVLDDQALIVNVTGRGVNVTGRGLVVITGCGHAGVISIARYAGRLTGGQPLHALPPLSLRPAGEHGCKPDSPDHGLISPSVPRTRRGTAEYASGDSSGCRLPARTSTTLCTWRPPACWTQETHACHEPSRSCISQASRWPTIPPLICTIGGHQGASRLLTWLVFESTFELSSLETAPAASCRRRTCFQISGKCPQRAPNHRIRVRFLSGAGPR